MNLLTISIILAGVLAMTRKIYLHFKLLDPHQRTFFQMAKYLGLDFFLPVFTRYNSRHLRVRKGQANQMLIIFYACCLLTIFLVLMKYTD
jgi:hypothetical protein